MMRVQSRWSSLSVLLILLGLYGGQGSGLSLTSPLPPPQPPSQAPVGPNASAITAHVLKYSIWNAKLLGSEEETTLYSLVLEVLTSEPVSPEGLNLVKAGDVIEAFSKEMLAPELFGKKIKATVRLVGDERGQRFWISAVDILE